MTGPVTPNLIGFARYLRDRGLPVVPETSALMLRATVAVGLADRGDAYRAMRAVTVTRPEHLPIFDDAFSHYFGRMGDAEEEQPGVDFERGEAQASTPLFLAAESDEPGAIELAEQVGASAIERLAHRDFGELTDEELEDVRDLIARMAWAPADARSRRWMSARSGTKPDLRRSLRGLVGAQGEMVPLEWARRRHRKRPLLVIADVSGSMERYVEMFLYFVHATRARMGRVEAFVFSTRLTRITRELAGRDARLALAQVSHAVDDWSGGTKIGEALETFNRDWSRRVTSRGPIALIISDGWDCGDPDVLAREMTRFRRTVHRVLWLNPLAGRSGYEPATRGMKAVLPSVDDLLPAASVAQLRDVVALIEAVPARP